ncbi:MAG: hypothetical protein PHR30_15015 [Gallionellaceae bacterium]|nr:hypothetical protein [Gallionellaceae bacterium]
MGRLLVLIISSLLVGGCANLDEVGRFAGESARLASYKELTTHFRDTYAREAPFLAESALGVAQANDRKRQEAYGDLVNVHDTVALYMATLAKLAGDNTFDLSKGIDSVTGQIKAHPDFGLDEKQVDAISNLAKLASKWALAAYQQDAVRDMIRAGQGPMQVSLDGLRNLLRLYRKTHENERKEVLGLFQTEFLLAKTQPKDPLLMALAKVQYRDKQVEYDAVDQKFGVALKAIDFISEGHSQLYQNVDNLSSKEIKNGLTALAKDLKGLREQLQALQ